jgi:hypothetical protein
MTTPGVHVEEIPGRRLIEAAPSVIALVGQGGPGPADKATPVHGVMDFESAFAGRAAQDDLHRAVTLFFDNGGTGAWVVAATALPGAAEGRTGLHALDEVAGLSLLALPGVTDPTAQAAAVAYAEARGAFVVLDLPPSSLASRAAAEAWLAGAVRSPNAAAYPPLLLSQGGPTPVASSGAVAGVVVRIDAPRGVWKAPSGMEAKIAGASGTPAGLTAADRDALALEGLNPLRRQPNGDVLVWGARTLANGTTAGADWRYVPVRRLVLFIEQSLTEGLKWTVFSPNAAPLWAQVRQDVQTFLSGLFRQGAFQGVTPKEAYYVRCDASTMTQADLDNGRLVVQVGVAPLKPAEFVIFSIGLRTSDSQATSPPPPPPPP